MTEKKTPTGTNDEEKCETKRRIKSDEQKKIQKFFRASDSMCHEATSFDASLLRHAQINFEKNSPVLWSAVNRTF